ncbi:adenosylmethionine decarboxylase [Vibrio bivalvicida]|uniref:Uncharacterized protein n=1 Tax=Vibrio bivalvicida TaxID=1276888 RepID=A0A177Y6I1_9VIBR|nr:adenosylmethionine decarboxylase [Vibrio bivalvicida]OAJ96196.1 hypothetical protein APB76_00060 [Vibrio bivalvicida]
MTFNVNDSVHDFKGKHAFGELYGIESSKLNDTSYLENLLIEGIKSSGATLCSIQSKKFEPSGVTLLALLSESHASIHTYPEKGSMFVDAFTCGSCNPEEVIKTLEKGLSASHTNISSITRG